MCVYSVILAKSSHRQFVGSSLLGWGLLFLFTTWASSTLVESSLWPLDFATNDDIGFLERIVMAVVTSAVLPTYAYFCCRLRGADGDVLRLHHSNNWKLDVKKSQPYSLLRASEHKKFLRTFYTIR